MNTTTNRKGSRLVRIAVTTALATTALSGCTGTAAPSANYSAAQAEAAMKKGKLPKAVQHAEAAVLATPRDAGARTLLANAYLGAGRFQSAATTYGEAVELGDTSARTIISYALALTANGDNAGALETLARYETALDPADYGLAVALAGRPEEGVHVLANALRNGSNTAKTRQNLAYAFALQGNWGAARLMAAEDVPADQVGDRLSQWAEMARPEMFQMRVAALLGVTAVADPGQPTMLALANHQSVEQLAVESSASTDAPAAEAAPAFALASELPAVAPAATSFDNAFVDSGEASLADAGISDRGRYTAPPVAKPAPVAPVAPRSVARAAAPAPKAAPAPMAKGSHNIQLGSYYSMSDAQAAWKRFQAKYPEIADAEKIITKARVNGKIYYRVAAGGFAEKSARSMCSTVKAKGAGCIAYASSRPLPGALDNRVQVASR